jgi:hypothetical protein
LQPFLSPAERRAVIVRVEARLSGAADPAFRAARSHGPPALERPADVSDQARRRNLERMCAWVEGARAAAAARSDADAFLLDLHDRLGLKMSELGGAEAHRHLRGLTAFDLGEAQTALLRPLTNAVGGVV